MGTSLAGGMAAAARAFDGASPLNTRRAHSSMSGRVGAGGGGSGVGGGGFLSARSWHPSPFASDEDASSDEPQFYKEEKKNRIKMEIARRRQQIEENACLHEELTRLAKLRETAEMSSTAAAAAAANASHVVVPSSVSTAAGYGGIVNSPATAAAAAAAAAAAHRDTSVLKSVDEILRDGDPYHHHYGGTRAATGGVLGRLQQNSFGDPFSADFSPMNSELSDLGRGGGAAAAGRGVSGLVNHNYSYDGVGAAGVAAAGYGKYSKHSAAAFK